MKIGFSTLGCPDWTLSEILATAKDLGYNGVEIRGIASEMYAPTMKCFSDEQLDKTIQKLGGLEIPILTSNATIATKTNIDTSVKEAMEYIELAGKIGAKYVRIMCTNRAMLDDGDFELATGYYKALAQHGKKYNVTPLMETNGMFCDSSLLKKFMDNIGESNIGVLWDIHHPYRYNRETISETVKNIGEYIKYTHIKDSVRENGTTVYKMLSNGDLPLKEAINGLKSIGYDGYVTLEWIKRWQPDLAAPGIVFARYIDSINSLLKE